jgi:hypothetical protein
MPKNPKKDSKSLWICDVCGDSSPYKGWEFIVGEDVQEKAEVYADPESLYLQCPRCHGAMVYKLVGHVHWNPFTGKKAKVPR